MKFMESFLANRPKVEGGPVLPGSESLDSGGFLGLSGDELGYGEEAPRSGGFQSLRTALLEAGSVVSATRAGEVGGVKPSLGAGLSGGGASDSASGSGGVDPAHGHAHEQEPTVELITNEGRIEKVVVTCSCGRRMELDCAY